MIRRVAPFAAVLLAAAAAGCVSPDEGPPLRPPLLAESGDPANPVRWYLAEGGILVEAAPVEPAAPSLGVETEEWSLDGHDYVRVIGLREDGWGGGGAIRPGEDLLGLAGRPVAHAADIEAALEGAAPGDAVEAILGGPDGVRRAAVVVERKAGLRRRKLEALVEKQRTGLSFCLVDAETAAAVYGTPEPRVLLSRVLVGSPAWLAGLRRGDRVLSVEGRAPSTPEEAIRFLRGPPGQPAFVEIETSEGPRRFTFVRKEDVEASGGFSLPLVVGYTGDRRYWTSYLLGGLLWSRVRVWWNVQDREPAAGTETGSLLWLVRVRSSPESSTLWLFGIPIRLRGDVRE